MTDEAQAQALAFMAGANSMWLGDTLLTTDNPDKDHDSYLFQRLGIKAEERDVHLVNNRYIGYYAHFILILPIH